MKEEHELTLAKDFPTLFPLAKIYPKAQSPLEIFGCEVLDGWFPIIHKLCEDIVKTNPSEDCYFLQIKEKFGTLRIYMTSSSKEVYDLIDEAEKQSESTCENCGSTDGVTLEGSWVKALCPPCRGK
ncbi:MAG: hypothetical protein ACW99G_02510 [Candidatus Thorarchaeota archaeon]|jgi:hypothetical protein